MKMSGGVISVILIKNIIGTDASNRTESGGLTSTLLRVAQVIGFSVCIQRAAALRRKTDKIAD